MKNFSFEAPTRTTHRHGLRAAGLLGILVLTSACGGDEDPLFNEGTTGGQSTGNTGLGAPTTSTAAPTTSTAAPTTSTAAPTTSTAAPTTGTPGSTTATTGGTTATTSDPDGGTPTPEGGMETDGGTSGGALSGECCDDGDCLCHTEPPATHSSDPGPYAVGMYNLAGVGCVFYPEDAEPPFAAVAVSDGFTGTGGCGSLMTQGWGPLYASHGIVLINVEVPFSGVPERGEKLTGGIAALKAENENPSSELFGKLAGRYGVSGFSMGGGGATIAAKNDPSLLTCVPIMSHMPVSEISMPTLFTCGNSDTSTFGGCGTHGSPAYNSMPASTPKGIFTVTSGHAGNPSNGDQGKYVLPFQKLFLEGDERWRELVETIPFDESEGL